MKQYIDMLKEVMTNGVWKGNRTGVTAKGISGFEFKHDLRDGFPLLTTKRMAKKTVKVELEGFIGGITDKRWYQKRGCKIWSEWCNPEMVLGYPNKIIKQIQAETSDLGCVYGRNWRRFGDIYRPTPQIVTEYSKDIKIKKLKNHKLLGNVMRGKYGKYTVIEFEGSNANHVKKFSVQFHKSGYIRKNVDLTSVENRKVRDPYFPSLVGVACTGDYSNSKLSENIIKKLLGQWRSMICRCYSKDNPAYKNYGNKNIYVCNRWLVFEYFLKDVVKLEGWEVKLNNWTKYELDKDILGVGHYGVESCAWVTLSDNGCATSQSYYFSATSPRNEKFENQVGLRRFCRKHGLKSGTVEASMVNKTFTHGGWKFKRLNGFKINPIQAPENNKKIKPSLFCGDQMASITRKLKINPNDRRMVCTAWNPQMLHTMALPPCHFSWNLVHIDGVLNLNWSQRSCDTFLGVPFNIASYAYLLHLLAHYSGLTAGVLRGDLMDLHIYENQIEQVEEQISRTPLKLCEVETIGGDSIFDWTHDMTKEVDYISHATIKAEVAI